MPRKKRSVDDPPQKYRCTSEGCTQSASTPSLLERHMAVHDAPHIPCPDPHCDKTFTQRWNLITHIRSVHHKIRSPCPHCKKSFSSQSNLSHHISRVHPHLRDDTSQDDTPGTSRTRGPSWRLSKTRNWKGVDLGKLLSGEIPYPEVPEGAERVVFPYRPSNYLDYPPVTVPNQPPTAIPSTSRNIIYPLPVPSQPLLPPIQSQRIAHPRPSNRTPSRASSASNRMRLDFLCEPEEKQSRTPSRRLTVNDLLIQPEDEDVPASRRQARGRPQLPTHTSTRYSPYDFSSHRTASTSSAATSPSHVPALGEERARPRPTHHHTYSPRGDPHSEGYSTPGPPPSTPTSSSESPASTTYSLDLPTAVPSSNPWGTTDNTPRLPFAPSTSDVGRPYPPLFHQGIRLRSPQGRGAGRSYHSATSASSGTSADSGDSDMYASEPY